MDDKVIVDLLGQVGNLFTSSLELKETIDFMLKAASDLAVCDAATVFLLDDDDLTLAAIATFPFGELVLARCPASSWERALLAGRPNNARSSPLATRPRTAASRTLRWATRPGRC